MSSVPSPPQSQQLTAPPWPLRRGFSLQRHLHRAIPAGTCCPRLKPGRKTRVPGGMEAAVICAGLSGWRREDALPDGCFLRNWLVGSRVSSSGVPQPSCCSSNPAVSRKSIRGMSMSRERLCMVWRTPWSSSNPPSWGSGGGRKRHRAGNGLSIRRRGLPGGWQWAGGSSGLSQQEPLL